MFVFLGALSHTRSVIMRFIVGALGYVVSPWPLKEQENKLVPHGPRHPGVVSSCGRSAMPMWLIPIKTLDIKALVSFPCYQYSMCIASCYCWEMQAHSARFYWERTSGRSCLVSPGLSPMCLPYVPLRFADFNWYPFALINKKKNVSNGFSEFCNSFQWVIKPDCGLGDLPKMH